MSAMRPSPMNAAHFSTDICEFIGLLHQHDVRYVIVGGEAVIFHGHARLTGDIDFFYEASTDNAERLYRALSEFWHGRVPGIQTVSDLMIPGIIFQFGRPPNRIDLMNTITAISFSEAWDTRVIAHTDIGDRQIPVYYLGAACLIRNKQAINRPKDLDDLDFLFEAFPDLK